MLIAATSGFATGFSLILAIGAQNAFVLRQGLIRRHVFWICLFCAASDAVLISLGILLADRVGAQVDWSIDLITWAGALFLIFYGGMALGRSFSPGRLIASGHKEQTLFRALLTCFALTWLNPHVYLDTVGLIGIVSVGFDTALKKAAFWGGAVAASFVFFFALGFGARLLAPALSRPKAWQILDACIAILMWSIAASLITRTL